MHDSSRTRKNPGRAPSRKAEGQTPLTGSVRVVSAIQIDGTEDDQGTSPPYPASGPGVIIDPQKVLGSYVDCSGVPRS